MLINWTDWTLRCLGRAAVGQGPPSLRHPVLSAAVGLDVQMFDVVKVWTHGTALLLLPTSRTEYLDSCCGYQM